VTQEAIRDLIAYPIGAGILIWCAWWMWRLQQVMFLRMEHVVGRLRDDLRDAEKHNDKLEAELSVLRDRMRADRQQCDEQIARLTVQVVGLRRELTRYTPPDGTPTVREEPS